MLPKKGRVEKGLFPATLQKGKTFHSPNLSLRVLSGSLSKEPRFSFVVSKKVSNKAHERNRLKRQGYFSIEQIVPTITNNHAYVFFFKKGAIGVPYTEIEKEVLFLLERSGAFA